MGLHGVRAAAEGDHICDLQTQVTHLELLSDVIDHHVTMVAAGKHSHISRDLDLYWYVNKWYGHTMGQLFHVVGK